MKKAIIMVLMVVALMTMAQECDTGNNTETGKIDPFLGGTRGLSIQFVEEAPPSEVFDGGSDPFDIELLLQNVGEVPISKEDVYIKLGGFNPTDFGKVESDFIKDGISENMEETYKDFEGNVLESPEVYVTFSNLNFQESLAGNKNIPLWVDVCYNYQTKVVADGCIRKNPRSTDAGVCIVNEEKPVYNSGAPVQVTLFQEQPAGTDTVKYLFTIKHMGTGSVFAPNSKCPSDNAEQENVIEYTIESSVADLLCSGADDTGKHGTFKLRPGKEYVLRCTQQKVSELDYIDRINIELNYDYKESITKSVLIKKNI